MFDDMFRLRKPCSNCPFRKEGAIELRPGRLTGIIAQLLDDDWSTFSCHKTTHGEHVEDEDGSYQYEACGTESMCAGAIIYLEKAGRPTVGMRLARTLGHYDPSVLLPHYGEVIELVSLDDHATARRPREA